MTENIEAVEFTIFDTETTGLDPFSGDRVVELAALRVKGQERLAEFDRLINPLRPISAGAFAVNKITPEMLANAPGMEKVIPEFMKFIQGSCLCSYNAEFDLNFMDNEFKLTGLSGIGNFIVFDVLTMARKLLPGLSRYPLWFVAKELGVRTEQQHRAFADVEMTWEVFKKLKGICRQKGIDGFAEFLSRYAFRRPIPQNSDSEKIALIQKCIQAKEVLKFRYLSSHTSQISLREVIPVEISQDSKYKYLTGYCCLNKEQRTFRLDNILSFENS